MSKCKKHFELIVLWTLSATCLFSLEDIDADLDFIHVKEYSKPFELDATTWNTITPYLLPENHRVKKKLDQIFISRATSDLDSLERLGFKVLFRGYQKIVVAFHHEIEGFFIKFYLDYGNDEEDWNHFLKRIEGAEIIRSAIKHSKLQNFFKVPKKWLYPLPDVTQPVGSGYYPKKFILVVEDMNILNDTENHKKWRSLKSKQVLNLVFGLLQETGLYDCARAQNLPWSHDGRLAFVDTHSYHIWPINFHPLGEFLSLKMREYWYQLIHELSPESYTAGYW